MKASLLKEAFLLYDHVNCEARSTIGLVILSDSEELFLERSEKSK
ncbi:MAG: hypothetical protein JWR38_4501 [Mucilaginibacter sp.]|nr:hypothetical protein [Mucilaginibacter sp.]